MDYSETQGIKNEPAFAWWVPFTLRKRDVVISAVKLRVRKTTHKYRIQRQLTKHAKEIDGRNNNQAWQDAIDLEMKNVGVAFKILESEKHVPLGYTKSSGHLGFDFRMNFQCKTRWAKDGH